MWRHAALWLCGMRPGDYALLLVAVLATGYAGRHFWGADHPALAVVRAGGKTVASLPLDRPGRVQVRGPLGLTYIEVEPGRARVAADPGPRQYCVKQGGLTRSGAAAICAPNEVSLLLEGRRSSYDSLSY
jgi:hypothetical protein